MPLVKSDILNPGLFLSQCAIYLASSAKSNASYMAISEALDTVKKTGDLPVPFISEMHLRRLMKNMDYSKGYEYSHSYENNFSAQEYLPEEIKGSTFYEPGKNPREEEIRKHLKFLWKEKYKY